MTIKNEDLTEALAEYLRTNSKGSKLLAQGQIPEWCNNKNKFYPVEFELAVNISTGYSVQEVIDAFIEKLNNIVTTNSYVTLRYFKSVTKGEFTYLYTYVSSIVDSQQDLK